MSTGLNPHPGVGPATQKWQKQQIAKQNASHREILKEEALRELLGLVDEIDALSVNEIAGFIMRHSTDERTRVGAAGLLLEVAQHNKPQVVTLGDTPILLKLLKIIKTEASPEFIQEYLVYCEKAGVELGLGEWR